MTVGIMDIAAVCAVAACGDVADIDEAPPPALLTMDEIYATFLTPDYAPFKDEETAVYERRLNDKDEEIRKLEKEVDKLERSNSSSNDIDGDNTDSNSKGGVAVDGEVDKDAGAGDMDSGVDSHSSMEGEEAVGQTYEATYYSAFCPTCGEWGGITATGDDISESIYVDGKRVVAVDPNVIPLGSTVKVTTPSETFEARALDSGGDIRGNRIDILVNSTEEAYSKGRHDVTVEVLN